MHRMWSGSGQRLTGALLLSLSIALVVTAATPRSVCACNYTGKIPLTTMRAELRNLVTAQEAYFADSGRYALTAAELTPSRYSLAAGVELVGISSWGTGYEARVRYPSRTDRECWIAAGPLPDGSFPQFEGEPRCDPPPLDTDRFIMAAFYALLVLVAIAVRVARAGGSLPPMNVGVVSVFLLLAVVHPFWTGYRTEGGGCSFGASVESISITLAVIIATWMVVRSREEWKLPRPS